MRTYTQLTQEQRYQISALKRMGHSRNEIAQVVEVHRSTISRELGRNTGERGYRPKQAHEKAISRRAKAKPRITATTWKVVEEKLREDWSPEQVSGWLKKHQGTPISNDLVVEPVCGLGLYHHRR
jgi:IS30 family transposase